MWYHWLFVLTFLTAILLVDFATAGAHWNEMFVKHTWNTVPAPWESLGNTTAGAIIELHIALKPDQESALINALSQVSNPEHQRYGAYLSKEQVAELVSPHPETLKLVRSWLLDHGIQPSSISTTHGGSWLTVIDVLVSQANQLLGASYQLYRNSKTNDTIIRTVSYALPMVLHTHIQTVTPTTYFPSTRWMRETSRRRSSGDPPAQAHAASGKVVTARLVPGMTPSALRWLYKTNSYTPIVPHRNKLGILGIDDDYPGELDLTRFMEIYRSDAIDADFSIVQWNWPNGSEYNPRNTGYFANFGIQYAAAMTYPTPLIFYSIGGDMEWNHRGFPTARDMYSKWLGNLLGAKSPPQTISIVYGEYEQDLPVDYAAVLCDLFARLGSRGVTVLAASGRDGVGAGDCLNADEIVQFIPEFPSSCPYVTSVGGTAQFRPEMAANLSGGGFSRYFGRPRYQRFGVIEYLRKYPDFYEGLYNRNGRGYPDISAQALDYQYIINGEIYYMNGTICSVTTVAAIVSLVNDFRIFNNLRPLGFINPLMYSGGFRGLKDIMFGGNPGCNTDGFLAAEGWDPVTGLGTPDFLGMIEN